MRMCAFMNPTFSVAAVLMALTPCAVAHEFHVATNGSDANFGAKKSPLRTIQRAAELAQPGDVITVHAGIYRERVNPPRGGISDEKRITYQAAPGEKVVITGSEVVRTGRRCKRHLDSDPAEFVLWPFQSLSRPDSWRLV